MKLVIFTLLIGIAFALAYAEPAPSKLQSLLARLQDDDGEKLAILQQEEEDGDDDLATIEEALAQIIGGTPVGKSAYYKLITAIVSIVIEHSFISHHIPSLMLKW